MKKLLAIFLTITCIMMLGACAKKDNTNNGNSNDLKLEKAITGDEIYFVAKLVELYEITMLIEVTDKGNSGVAVGDRIVIPTEKISTALADNYVETTDNYLCIEFDGNIMETSPLELGTIHEINVINEEGYIIL